MDDGFESCFSRLEVRGVENGSDILGDARAHVLTRHLCILLEMKLAALPQDGRENGSAIGREAHTNFAAVSR